MSETPGAPEQPQWPAGQPQWQTPQPLSAPQYPQAYGQPGVPAPYQQPPQNSGKSIAILVLGIVGLVFTCAYGIGVIPSIVALALAPSAKREIATAQGSLGGSGFIQAGSICSWISVGLTAAGLVIGLFVLLIAMASS